MSEVLAITESRSVRHVQNLKLKICLDVYFLSVTISGRWRALNIDVAWNYQYFDDVLSPSEFRNDNETLFFLVYWRDTSVFQLAIIRGNCWKAWTQESHQDFICTFSLASSYYVVKEVPTPKNRKHPETDRPCVRYYRITDGFEQRPSSSRPLSAGFFKSNHQAWGRGWDCQQRAYSSNFSIGRSSSV